MEYVLYSAGFSTLSPTPSCYDGQLRFSNIIYGSTLAGASYVQGRVEVCVSGIFGAICDVGWDQLDAQVACREFGYNSTSLGMFRHACLVATLDRTASQSFFFFFNQKHKH